MLSNRSTDGPLNIPTLMIGGHRYYCLYFVTAHSTEPSKKRVLHHFSIPESMPLRHAVALAWDDFEQKKPGFSERVKQGYLTVTLTAEPDPGWQQHCYYPKNWRDFQDVY